MKILLVCTGNTCRSPMAAAYLAAGCRQIGLGCEIGSAGVCASPGTPASAAACETVRADGLDLGNFRSRQFTPELARKYDLLLGLTRDHCLAMRRIAPGAENRIFPLAFYATGRFVDIPDPYGGDAARYRATAEALKPIVSQLIAKLNSKNNSNNDNDNEKK